MVVGLRLGHNGGCTVVGVARLGLGRNGGCTVVRGAARGVGGNGGVRRVDVALLVVNGPRDPLEILHVGQPDVVTSLASPDGSRNEGANVSEDYRTLGQRGEHDHTNYGTYGLSS